MTINAAKNCAARLILKKKARESGLQLGDWRKKFADAASGKGCCATVGCVSKPNDIDDNGLCSSCAAVIESIRNHHDVQKPRTPHKQFAEAWKPPPVENFLPRIVKPLDLPPSVSNAKLGRGALSATGVNRLARELREAQETAERAVPRVGMFEATEDDFAGEVWSSLFDFPKPVLPLECLHRHEHDYTMAVACVSQNERWLPLIGWGSNHLLPSDPVAFSSFNLKAEVKVEEGTSNDSTLYDMWLPPTGFEWEPNGSWVLPLSQFRGDDGCTFSAAA